MLCWLGVTLLELPYVPFVSDPISRLFIAGITGPYHRTITLTYNPMVSNVSSEDKDTVIVN